MPDLKLDDCINAECPWSGKPVQQDSLTRIQGPRGRLLQSRLQGEVRERRPAFRRRAWLLTEQLLRGLAYAEADEGRTDVLGQRVRRGAAACRTDQPDVEHAEIRESRLLRSEPACPAGCSFLASRRPRAPPAPPSPPQGCWHWHMRSGRPGHAPQGRPARCRARHSRDATEPEAAHLPCARRAAPTSPRPVVRCAAPAPARRRCR